MRLRSFRRSAAVAAAALGAVTITAVSAPAGAQEEFILGSGQVESQLLRVGPSAGRLSFAPRFGLGFANYQNSVARAESRVADYAALDDSVPPELQEGAPSLRTDSTEEGAEKGVVRTTPDGSPLGATRQEVRANEQPFSEAVFVLGDAGAPGVVELRGGRAVSRTGIVDGKTREAAATVSYGRISLGGGAVVLQGATWAVLQRTGADEQAEGTFRVEGITIGGQALTPPEGGPTPEQWQQLNDGLAPLGLRLDPPAVEIDQGIVSITPLGIRVFANQVGRTAGPPLLEGLQPVRDPVAGGIIEQEPEAGSLFTVGDLVLGAVAGSGAIDVQLGGATAFTEGEAFDDPFGGFDLGSSPAGPVALGGSGSSGLAAGSPSADGAVGDEGSGAAGGGEVELAGSRRQAGTTGGPAAVVGLLGLLAVLAMAAADWWRMRHEPRRIALS